MEKEPKSEQNRILIIDDEEAVLRSIERYLRMEGFNVTAANSGAEGIKAMKEDPFNVVLTDIKMPEMDGLEVLTQIKSSYPKCEVIIISAYGEMKHAIEALRRGAYNYLQKPVDLDELKIAVDRAFEKRLRAEQFKAVQEQLYHAQKMESLGTLAGGVAHEFNNLMGGIIGYCDMALKYNEDELCQKALKTSLNAAVRAGEISKNLMRFARRTKAKKDLIDMNSCIRETVQLLHMDLESEHITIDLELGTLPMILVDESQFKQVILNLIINSRQSLQQVKSGRRRIFIRSWTENNCINVLLSDNGSGIKKELLARVFEPFFTTKGVISGGEDSHATGLGLSVVDGIVKSHGGEIEIESDEGTGTSIKFTIPYSGDENKENVLKVLVIDDDPAMQRIMSAILSHNECYVKTASSGQEGLHILKDEYFNVIFVDQSMPGLSGIETLRELQLICPDTPAIMLTALYTPSLARDAILAGARECLSKPINNNKLIFLARKYGGFDETYAGDSESDVLASDQKKILIIDDDETIRDVYKLILTRSGFDVTIAQTPLDAIRITKDMYFNLILMDMFLRDHEGTETIRQIRINNPYTPIIISTGQISNPKLRHGLNAGATKVLQKPVNPTGLVNEVSKLITIYAENIKNL